MSRDNKDDDTDQHDNDDQVYDFVFFFFYMVNTQWMIIVLIQWWFWSWWYTLSIEWTIKWCKGIQEAQIPLEQIVIIFFLSQIVDNDWLAHNGFTTINKCMC